jgi:hypothetical protein
MAPSARDIFYCVISSALGAYCMIADPSGLLASSEPLMASCSRNDITPEEYASTTGYHIYDPLWGFGIFKGLVCFITQFLYQLTQNSPAGSLAWMTTFAISSPLSILMAVEAGRKDAKGLVRFPLIVALLYQILGISVVFPLVWIPSWILGRGTGGVNKYRTMVSVPMIFPMIILSGLIFWLDPRSSLWTSCAAIIGGPGICFLNAVYWGIPDPDPKDPTILKDSNERSSMAFAFSGIIALGIWMWLVFIIAIPHYGFSLSAIYNDLWAEAPTDAVKFMTMDAGVLWLSGLIVLAYHNEFAGLEGVALSLVFGPGAGVALVLAGLCVDDDAQLQLAEKTVEAKKEAKLKEKLGKKD